jgi:glycosyltransferase involved in cell wall biosynthesis
VADILFNTVGHTQNNRKFAKLIDFNFVENNEVLQFLVQEGESQDRILQVSSGIDLQEYQPGPREASVVNLLNATQDELIVGFSGRWGPEKDPLMFVEIARRLSHLPIHFVMTGVGPLRPRIEEAIAAGKLDNRFHLVGEVGDVLSWIRSYDALVLPSRLDGRPVVVLEALALGVPVVASAVGGLPELVDDGVNGFLCVPGMAAHFARKIARLALDHELLVRMKTAARLSAEQNLDSRKMFSSYEQALRDLARTKKHTVPRS